MNQPVPPTEKPTSVRFADKHDIKRLYDLMVLSHEENGVGGMNKRKVMEAINFACYRKGSIVGVIDGPGGSGGLEGFLFMIFTTWWYGDDWFVSERVNFVHPDCRKTNHAKDLFQFGKWFSEQMKMMLVMGIITSDRLEAKIKLYQRQMPLAGATFVHNVDALTMAKVGTLQKLERVNG